MPGSVASGTPCISVYNMYDGKKCPCVRHKDTGVSRVLAPFVHNLGTRWR